MNIEQHICYYCDREYDADDLPPRAYIADTTTMAARDMGYTQENWVCGECEEGGVHWLAKRMYGVVFQGRNGELDVLERSHMYYEQSSNDILLNRLNEWLGRTDEAHVSEYELFRDFHFRDDEGWYQPFRKEDGQIAEPNQPMYYTRDQFPLGMEQFLHYVKALFTTSRRDGWRTKYFYQRPLGTKYHIEHYNWRMDDDGIGGWGSPIIFRISKRRDYWSYDDPTPTLWVLCGELETDYREFVTGFNPEKLFMHMLDHMGMKSDKASYD